MPAITEDTSTRPLNNETGRPPAIHRDRWEWRFFASADHLPPGLSFFYKPFLVVGSIMLFLILFVTTLGNAAYSSSSGPRLWLAIAAALFAVVHVYREARSAKRLSVTAWISYAIAMGMLSYETSNTIKDPNTKSFFAILAVLASVLLLFARILRTFYRPSHKS